MPIGISKLCKTMKESPTLAIAEKAGKLAKEGFRVIGFSVGEPDFQTPEYIRNATKYAIDHGYTKYTSVTGIDELKQAIINKFKRDQNLEYNLNQIIVSNGAKHSVYNCLRAILDPGDEVILPAPFWASYLDMIELCGGKAVIVNATSENQFIPNIDDVKKSITLKTKAILINSPSNPSGCVWTEALLREIGNLALKHSFYIISDEIYEKLIYDDHKHFSIASISEQIKNITIVINGVSKAYAMTGFRIGYAAASEEIISAMTTFQSQTTTSAASMAQYATAIALTDNGFCEQIRDSFLQRRDVLVEMINSIPDISCNKPAGAFYIMLDIRKCIGKKYGTQMIRDDNDFADFLLEDAKVVIIPGTPFYAEGFCRMSYALDIALAIEGVHKIKEFVAKLK